MTDNPLAAGGGGGGGSSGANGAAEAGLQWVCCARVPAERRNPPRQPAPGRRPASSASQVQRTSGQRVLHDQTVVQGSTKWLALETQRYVDGAGVERPWDRCVRTGADGTVSSNADAVLVVAVLSGGGLSEPEVLLVRQFRPPLDSFTVELPAGLVDTGESAAQAAARELREETGFVADPASAQVSPVLASSPGLTNEGCCMVTLPVDLDRAENRPENLQQELEETEFIDVLRCPCSQLQARLHELHAQGSTPHAAVWALAAGMRFTPPTSTP